MQAPSKSWRLQQWDIRNSVPSSQQPPFANADPLMFSMSMNSSTTQEAYPRHSNASEAVRRLASAHRHFTRLPEWMKDLQGDQSLLDHMLYMQITTDAVEILAAFLQCMYRSKGHLQLSASNMPHYCTQCLLPTLTPCVWNSLMLAALCVTLAHI